MSRDDTDLESLAEARALFEELRPFLRGVAYRMLGTHCEVDDILQDAFLRLDRIRVRELSSPRSYLAQLVTRLCIDHLRSARVRRENYVGPWLPEPIVEEGAFAPPMPPDEVSAMREDLSLALMFALERLSPLERAAFILHDVFDLDYADIAETLGREPAACRQLAARGRKHIREQRPRFAPSSADGHALLGAFASAAMSGDLEHLQTLLAEGVVFASDGGGKAKAATRVVTGPQNVAKLLIGIVTKHYADGQAVTSPALVNGQPGFVVRENGRVTQAMSVDIHEGLIVGVYSVRNPDKLRHLNVMN